MSMAPPERKALADLAWYVGQEGGVLTSGRLSNFCKWFPAHHALNIKQLCKNCPDFSVVDQAEGQWTIRLASVEQEAVRNLAAFIRSMGRPLLSKEFSDLQSSHKASAAVVYSGDRTLSRFCQEHDDTFTVETSPGRPGICIGLRSWARSELPILEDLTAFLCENGGSVSSERFQNFYAKHPAHREAIPNLRAFCSRHPDRFAISEGTNSPHWRVTLAQPPSAQLAARLAIFLEDCDQPMRWDQLDGFYKKNPDFRAVIQQAGGIRSFCEKYPGLLLYEALSGQTDKIYLPKHCCLFMRGICNFSEPHGKYLHASPAPHGPLRCGYGRRCNYGHWQLIEQQAFADARGSAAAEASKSRDPEGDEADSGSDWESSSSESDAGVQAATWV
ncbi:unnamed protein product [Symbiodinium natans]|uniref:Uncharacterized protein n=1 Tax=Symbiodinium natans TaxID=878477 RepID=A0A812Q6G0_9DINO|nr:unnamed protein product [Symbiodinium natans]